MKKLKLACNADDVSISFGQPPNSVPKLMLSFVHVQKKKKILNYLITIVALQNKVKIAL